MRKLLSNAGLKVSPMENETTTGNLLRYLNREEVKANIAWWRGMRNEHLAKGEADAANRCQEEINLWEQELEDHD